MLILKNLLQHKLCGRRLALQVSRTRDFGQTAGAEKQKHQQVCWRYQINGQYYPGHIVCEEQLIVKDKPGSEVKGEYLTLYDIPRLYLPDATIP